MLIAQMEQASRLADKAVANPMWFFFLLFIVLALAYAAGLRWIAGYFVTMHERLLADIKRTVADYHMLTRDVVNAMNDCTNEMRNMQKTLPSHCKYEPKE